LNLFAALIVIYVLIYSVRFNRYYSKVTDEENQAKNEKTLSSKEAAASFETVPGTETSNQRTTLSYDEKNADFDFRKAIQEIKRGT
ncbi:hypothetical protein KW850_33020, partial [Bacillus sp. sid0103]